MMGVLWNVHTASFFLTVESETSQDILLWNDDDINKQNYSHTHISFLHTLRISFFFKHPVDHLSTERFSLSCVNCIVSHPGKIIKSNSALGGTVSVPSFLSEELCSAKPLMELSFFYREGRRLFVGGTRIFLGSQRGGGPVFFSRSKGGGRIFKGHRGGTRIFPWVDQNFFA